MYLLSKRAAQVAGSLTLAIDAKAKAMKSQGVDASANLPGGDSRHRTGTNALYTGARHAGTAPGHLRKTGAQKQFDLYTG